MTRKTKEEQLNFADAFDWKLAHGGKRANAGRKKQEPTKVVRVSQKIKIPTTAYECLIMQPVIRTILILSKWITAFVIYLATTWAIALQALIS